MTCSSSRRPSGDSAGASSRPEPMQRRHRRLDRGQRRPQVVRQRVEQRRLQLLVAPRRLGLAGALEGRAELLIEPLDLAAALLGFELPPLGPRRELADDDRGDGERDEGAPSRRGRSMAKPAGGGSSTRMPAPAATDATSAGPVPKARAMMSTASSSTGAAVAVRDRRAAERSSSTSDGSATDRQQIARTRTIQRYA